MVWLEPSLCARFEPEVASVAVEGLELLDEYEIGRAYWAYNEQDFPLVDKNGKVISRALVDALAVGA